MAQSQKDDVIVPSWDGEISHWADYSGRVRLCYAQTPEWKRYTLAPRLVLKLKGKWLQVWTTSSWQPILEHSISSPSYVTRWEGCRFPTWASTLKIFSLKLRRYPAGDMVAWCNRVRGSYRKVQRSLARTVVARKSVATQTDGSSEETQQDSFTSSVHRRASQSEPQREPPGTPVRNAEREETAAETEGEQGDVQGARTPSRLLLRRSYLPSAAKLSIQAAAGNSLKFSDIEQAMRQQEDELMHQERNQQRGKQQWNFWVEKGGQWDLLLQEPDEVAGDDQDDGVKWVEQEAFSAMVH